MSYWLSLFLWQEVTYLAANTAHSFFSPRMRGHFSLSVKPQIRGNVFETVEGIPF